MTHATGPTRSTTTTSQHHAIPIRTPARPGRRRGPWTRAATLDQDPKPSALISYFIPILSSAVVVGVEAVPRGTPTTSTTMGDATPSDRVRGERSSQPVLRLTVGIPPTRTLATGFSQRLKSSSETAHRPCLRTPDRPRTWQPMVPRETRSTQPARPNSACTVRASTMHRNSHNPAPVFVVASGVVDPHRRASPPGHPGGQPGGHGAGAGPCPRVWRCRPRRQPPPRASLKVLARRRPRRRITQITATRRPRPRARWARHRRPWPPRQRLRPRLARSLGAGSRRAPSGRTHPEDLSRVARHRKRRGERRLDLRCEMQPTASDLQSRRHSRPSQSVEAPDSAGAGPRRRVPRETTGAKPPYSAFFRPPCHRRCRRRVNSSAEDSPAGSSEPRAKRPPPTLRPPPGRRQAGWPQLRAGTNRAAAPGAWWSCRTRALRLCYYRCYRRSLLRARDGPGPPVSRETEAPSASEPADHRAESPAKGLRVRPGPPGITRHPSDVSTRVTGTAPLVIGSRRQPRTYRLRSAPLRLT